MKERDAKICRATGFIVIIASLALLPWHILRQHQLPAQPGYYDPTDGEQSTLTNYLCIVAGIGIGCVFLWMASRSKNSK